MFLYIAFGLQIAKSTNMSLTRKLLFLWGWGGAGNIHYIHIDIHIHMQKCRQIDRQTDRYKLVRDMKTAFEREVGEGRKRAATS